MTEMNYRRAARLAKELRSDAPQLRVEVWPIAQGLAYLRVEGPTARGIVQLILRTEDEVASFRQLANAWGAARVLLYSEAARRRLEGRISDEQPC